MTLPSAYNMPTVRACAAPITARTGISLEQLCNHDKRRKVVQARWDLWAELILIQRWPMWTTARRFGVHHTTILYGLRKRAVERHGLESKPPIEAMRVAEINTNLEQAA